MPSDFKPNFMATGIGSLPHTDPGQAVADILSRIPEMPYWPQLPAMAPEDDMNMSFSSALVPLVEVDHQNNRLLAAPERETALAAFYERLFSGEQDSFGLSPEQAIGLYEFMKVVGSSSDAGFEWIKGQVTGPMTMAAGILGADGKALLYDDEVADALARGLGAAAAAQANLLAPLGKKILMFIDEPGLTGFGSAFTPISRERALEILSATLDEARSRADMVFGVHCCGNTDWSLLIDAGFDVINLDSAGFGQHLLLYPDALNRLFERGGAVAWGAVPTLEFKGGETAESLWAGLKELLDQLEAKGFDHKTLAEQSLVSPACGLGVITLPNSLRILDLTVQVSDLARQDFS